MLARELLGDSRGAEMDTKNDDSTTIREVSAARGGRAATPVLLIGSFLSESARVVNLDRPVTIGRGRSSDAGVRNQDAEVIVHVDRDGRRRNRCGFRDGGTGKWSGSRLKRIRDTRQAGLSRVDATAPMATPIRCPRWTETSGSSTTKPLSSG